MAFMVTKVVKNSFCAKLYCFCLLHFSVILSIRESNLSVEHSLFKFHYLAGNKWRFVCWGLQRPYSTAKLLPVSQSVITVGFNKISFIEMSLKQERQSILCVTKLYFWSSCRIFFMPLWKFQDGQMQKWRYAYRYIYIHLS